MIIQQYDVSLVRLKREHIEEVRYWRNTDGIRSKMQYREQITPEMQQKWFDEINDIDKYLYLLIQVGGRNVGLAHGKNILSDEPEGGMFIWDEEYLLSHIPVIVSIIISDITFYFLRKSVTYCKMLRSNKPAIKYNTNLGFRLCENQDDNENQLYSLSLQDYEARSLDVKNYLRSVYQGEHDSITFILEEEDEENGVADFANRYFSQIEDANALANFDLKRLS